MNNQLKKVVKDLLKGSYVQQAKEKIRHAVTFDPTDDDRLAQQPKARDGYRFPAPGSITGARVPNRVEDKDGNIDPWDVKAYTYDPRNLPSEEKVFLNGSKSPTELQEEYLIKYGKVGTKDPAVLNYDPSGLRAVHTAGYEAFEKEVSYHLPDHLVHYAWTVNGGEEALNAECDKKNIPYAIGKRYKWKKTPDNYNTYKW